MTYPLNLTKNQFSNFLLQSEVFGKNSLKEVDL